MRAFALLRDEGKKKRRVMLYGSDKLHLGHVEGGIMSTGP